jgi:hypothetical protein
MNYSNKYLALVSSLPPGEFWGAAWKERFPVWKEWTEFGKGDPSKLEQVIADYKIEINEAKPEVKQLPVSPPPVPEPAKTPQTLKSKRFQPKSRPPLRP